jgi:uncharacterized protein
VGQRMWLVMGQRTRFSTVDTREFQRLRSIKQLGTSSLVYPSATHTRFEHSLGTLYEAQRMVDYLCENAEASTDKIPETDISLIRLVALLHDVGHIPFGHTLEDETCVISGKHDDEERRNLLIKDSEIGRRIVNNYGLETLDLILKIMATSHKDVWKLGEHAYIADIVNNTLCADLLDYLKRDVYFCNLQETFGDRFMRYLRIQTIKNDPTLVKNENGPLTSKRLVIRISKPDSPKYRRDVLSELVGL